MDYQVLKKTLMIQPMHAQNLCFYQVLTKHENTAVDDAFPSLTEKYDFGKCTYTYCANNLYS